MSFSPYALGLSNQEQEYILNDLDVNGTLPAWLSGSLIRTAPSIFDIGPDSYQHWFDGLCMLHKFTFGKDAVHYASRFLESESRTVNLQQGRIVVGEFGTDPCRDFFQKAQTLLLGQKVTDNGVVNINKVGESWVACSETPLFTIIDPDTLESKGHYCFKDSLKPQTVSPHPHYDSAGVQYNFMVKFGPTSHYQVFRQAPDSAAREVIASIGAKEPSYMHSLGMTQRYMVLVCYPLVVNPLRLRFELGPFSEKYVWKPELGTQIYLIDKESGMVQHFHTEAFFAFHHVNAFEQDGQVMIDLVCYEDSQVINDLYLSNLRSGTSEQVAGILSRITVDPSANRVSRKALADCLIELPQINYEAVSTKPYQYVYGAGSTDPSKFLDVLYKVSVADGEVWRWKEEGCHPAEPIFVPQPGAKKEDDGVLLTIVLDTIKQDSFLLVLDAQKWEEVARVRVPHPINLGFHGQYFPN